MIFFKRKISLRTKISLSIVISLVALVIVLSLVSIKQQSSILKEELFSEKKSLADMAAIGAQSALLNYNPNFFKTIIKEVMEKEDIKYCRIINPEGEIFMADERQIWGKQIKNKAIKTEKTIVQDDPSLRGTKVVVAPIFAGSQRWTLWMGFSTAGLVTARNKMIYANLKVALLSILAGLFIAFFLARGITHPVKQLLNGVKAISLGNLGSRVNVQTKNEIGELAVSFNKMAQDLSKTLVSKDYVDNIISSMVDSLIVADAEGRIKTVNPATLDLLGYREEEIIGQLLGILFEDKEEWHVAEAPLFEEKIMKNLIKNGFVSNFEIKYIAKNGKKIPVIFSGSVMRGREGKIINIVCVAKNITECKRLEKELKKHRDRLEKRVKELKTINEQLQHEITQRKRAEEKLKEYSERLEEMVEQRTKELRDTLEQLVRREKLAVLGQLAGGVAHELRNPLGAIKNAAYFLNMALEEPEPDVKETLEILEKEMEISERIISSLLGFASPKPPTVRKVDIKKVVQETLFRTTVPENVEVVSQLDDTVPAILADPYQLGQVFENIILNAIQAIPEGGRLVVKSEVQSPEWVAVSFADTGKGVPKEELGKLFEPLFTTKAKGIGLGLAITKTLVEGHGGTIEVESEEGKGSTFTVRLPISGT